jgi:hypothetical protein
VANARIYLVRDTGSDAVQWVRAGNLASAIRFVARARFTAVPATTDQVWKAMAAGAIVADATESDAADLSSD